MSLICKPSIVPPLVAGEQAPIVNDGFLPDIDPDEIEAQVRFPGGVVPARVRAACIGAMLTIAPDLALWAAAQMRAGYAKLADVPAPQLDGTRAAAIRIGKAMGVNATRLRRLVNWLQPDTCPVPAK